MEMSNFNYVHCLIGWTYFTDIYKGLLNICICASVQHNGDGEKSYEGGFK